MKYRNPIIRSSFYHNDLGRTIYDTVMELKPSKVIEFGTLDGYSACCIGQALHELGRGHLFSYDLWDDYDFNHGELSKTQYNLNYYGVQKYVTLLHGDFFYWDYEPADLYLIDISNNGDIIKYACEKIKGGVIMFEGGTEERDNIEWMKTYNKTPIIGSVPFKVINPLFPALSVCI